MSTVPNGAKVYLDNELIGVTPISLRIKRQSRGHIRLELPGYQTAFISQERVFNNWFIGSVAAGIIGVVVDIANSNFTRYDTAPVVVQLRPIDDTGRMGPPLAIEMVPIG